MPDALSRMPAISSEIWSMKYQLRAAGENGKLGEPIDKTVEDTWTRVADALAGAEEGSQDFWFDRFYEALEGFKFMPGGRIIAGAGSGRDVSYFNCFQMGDIPDSMDGIFSALREAALTMQAGGGIGYNFSTLRPKGAPVRGVGADASGPLSFMGCWNTMCSTVESAGYRRGAMMGVMADWHPDIEAFIEAKADPTRLRQFNMSVLVSDLLMAAVKADGPWPLTFDGKVYKTISARALWDKIMRSTYAYAEPGVIFIDRVNRRNNLRYCETITGTNPCGEIPMGPYSNCLLGSINLPMLVTHPFTKDAIIDTDDLRTLTTTAVRMLDNVIEVSPFPLPQQKEQALAKRRIGLGVTGLADALIMCGVDYGSPAAVSVVERWMSNIEVAAYLASADLAREKGSFPLYDRDQYLAGEHIKGLAPAVREVIAEKGMRNSHTSAVAPTGTISIVGCNVSSGIEPIFSLRPYTRKILMPDGSRVEREVADYAVRLWRQLRGDEPLPPQFVDVESLSPQDHLVMQATVQRFVDQSISKTINLPVGIDFEEFKGVYAWAYENDCKGCTTYRPNEVTGSVLSVEETPAEPAPAVQTDDGVVHRLTPPLPSPDEVEGRRYRIRWPDTDHALYCQVNHIDEGGRKRPWEVFLISNHAESEEWRVALGRMISAVFKKSGDVAFVAQELKVITDKKGGAWMPRGERRVWVPSIIAEIGYAIEKHMRLIGFIPAEAQEAVAVMDVAVGDDTQPRVRGRQCPGCGEFTLIRQENCDRCSSCTYDKCG